MKKQFGPGSVRMTWACASLLATCGGSAAQPICVDERGEMFAIVPDRVLIRASGEIRIDTRMVPLRPGQSAEEAQIAQAPLFGEFEGAEVEGYVVRIEDAGRAYAAIPIGICLDADRHEYRLKTSDRLIVGGVLPGEEIRWGGPNALPVEYSGCNVIPVLQAAPGPGLQVRFAPDFARFDAAFPGQRNRASAVIDRVRARFEELLSQSVGLIDIVIQFTPLTGSTGSRTLQSVLPKGYNLVKTQLINVSEGNNEPNSELNLYRSGPVGNVPFRAMSDGVVRNAVSLAVSPSEFVQLAVAPDEATEAVIQIDTSVSYDFDARDGIAPNTNDFEAALMHECFHALGFVSLAETPQADVITVWDYFRFAQSNGPAFGATAIESLPRELRPTVEAVYSTLFNDQFGTFEASRGKRTGGDGFQADHWRSLTRRGTAGAIGLMDPAPTDASRSLSLAVRFFKQSDLQALDIIGWNLAPSFYFTAPAPVILTFPVASAVTTSTPVFTWDANGVSNRWSLFIYAGAQGAAGAEVFEALDLADLSFSIAAPLAPGEYSWRVTGESLAGFDLSEFGRFSVGAACRGDFNHDGGIDPDDLSDFISCYFDVPPCLGSDFNGDGGVDPDDLSDYINAYFAGC